MPTTITPVEDCWLNIPQAGEHIGTTEWTIRRMIARGELKATRFGPKLIRIKRSDLDKAGKPVTRVAELLGA
ncbi:MAG: helix-turn-helix domain-containing protein [Propionicimonas sp.]|jgi:excisionase family DNA binding protein|uniref:helix-turn-helix domain-containing protein n=1 Tax=Propionicimonas sp. TaxID=1955623 RepID=UPI002B1EEC51|nr:helix-turn-helix domain-containing protein [Propionicimonas sp.]MEA4945707.1 helix-turn-helix domain-containing protein [Propionicimonas sp.]